MFLFLPLECWEVSVSGTSSQETSGNAKGAEVGLFGFLFFFFLQLKCAVLIVFSLQG